MAKPRHNSPSPESSPRGMLAILAVGALLVAGLVVWALTRTVETTDTATTSTTETTVATATTAIDTGTTPPVDTVPRGFNTPLAPTTTAGITTTSNAQPAAANEANFPRISAEDLREKMKAGAVTVIDVRPPLAYEGEHIAGSLSMAVASVESSLDLLPADKSKEIVAYCTCPAEESSIAAGLILNKHGYNKVYALFGGLTAWRNLGYPIERGAPK